MHDPSALVGPDVGAGPVTPVGRALRAHLQPVLGCDIPGLQLAARCWPAGGSQGVPGDFFDTFPVDDRTHAMLIGDVCGTGPAAAVIGAAARHTVRASAWHGDRHDAVLRYVDAALRRSWPDTLCTAVYATVTATAGGQRVQLACAGHPLPVLVPAFGRPRLVGVPGMLLGAFPAGAHAVTELRLGTGDVLVLYTDGVTDLPPPHDLTPDEWCRTVGAAVRGAASADAAATAIAAVLARRGALRRADDDIALVVARAVAPVPVPPRSVLSC